MSELIIKIYQKYVNSFGPEQIASPKALRIIERYLEKFVEEVSISAVNNLNTDSKKVGAYIVTKARF